MSNSTLIAVLAIFGLLGWLAHLWRTLNEKERALSELQARFGSVVDDEAEAEKVRAELSGVRSEYSEKKAIFDRLKAQIDLYERAAEDIDAGFSFPEFRYSDSKQYIDAIKDVTDRQKKLVRWGNAVFCTTNWFVNDSRREGQKMTTRAIKMTVRAFNNECKDIIRRTRWNNRDRMIDQIHDAFERLNKFNESNSVLISDEYKTLKIEELLLVHEKAMREEQEKEERRERRREELEQKKAEEALERAEREEQKLAERLRKEKEKSSKAPDDPATKELLKRIEQLEVELAKAHERTERARSLAEQTRCGYVYIISNVGSFGEDVVKIGLTRRLDPDDRVRELGDASVPFRFDTHAIIYSDDAPGLEQALHSEFAEKRINAVNLRKEFFRVSISEVEDAIGRLAPEATFFADFEADEYKQTLATRRQILEAKAKEDALSFPDAI